LTFYDWLFYYALTLVYGLAKFFAAGFKFWFPDVIAGYPPLFVGFEPFVTAWLLDWDESDFSY